MYEDAQIQSVVEQELKWESSIRGADIQVSVRNGVVTLLGTVPCYVGKFEAERVVQKVPGVRSVADRIQVVPTEEFRREDHSIALAAGRALEWDCEVPTGKVRAEVKEGWITLFGDVEWEYQREAAVMAVQRLTGVRGVSSEMVLRPRVHARDIQVRIEDNLKQLAAQDSHRIHVQTKDGRVILSGEVHSFSERKSAENAAKEIPGVTEVVSDIRVSMYN